MKRSVVVALLLAATLSGCVIAPPVYTSRPYVHEPTYRSAVIGVAPGPGYVWIDGLWRLNGGHRSRPPGRWEHDSHRHGGDRDRGRGWRR